MGVCFAPAKAQQKCANFEAFARKALASASSGRSGAAGLLSTTCASPKPNPARTNRLVIVTIRNTDRRSCHNGCILIPMLTLRQLRYLDALARHEHFGRAAEECAVSQPALSMQIRDLERELRAELVERRQGGVGLTQIGAEVARRAAQF